MNVYTYLPGVSAGAAASGTAASGAAGAEGASSINNE